MTNAQNATDTRTPEQLEADADMLDAALLAPSLKSASLRKLAQQKRDTDAAAFSLGLAPVDEDDAPSQFTYRTTDSGAFTVWAPAKDAERIIVGLKNYGVTAIVHVIAARKIDRGYVNRADSAPGF